MSVVLYAENANWHSCVFDTRYSFSHNDPDECWEKSKRGFEKSTDYMCKSLKNECIINFCFFSLTCCVFVRHEIVNEFGVRFVFVSNSIGLRTTSNNDSVVLFARHYEGVKNNVFH